MRKASTTAKMKMRSCCHALGKAMRLRRNLFPQISISLSHRRATARRRSEEHTSELQSLMRTSYAVFCLKKKNSPLTLAAPPFEQDTGSIAQYSSTPERTSVLYTYGDEPCSEVGEGEHIVRANE